MAHVQVLAKQDGTSNGETRAIKVPVNELIHVSKQILVDYIHNLPDKRENAKHAVEGVSRLVNIYSDSGWASSHSQINESIEEEQEEMSGNNSQDCIKEEDQDQISIGENESNAAEQNPSEQESEQDSDQEVSE